MNTILKTFALLLAAGVPAAFGAESFGVVLPSVVNTSSLFGAFVLVLTLLTVLADYRPLPALRAPRRSSALANTPRSVLRLAA